MEQPTSGPDRLRQRNVIVAILATIVLLVAIPFVVEVPFWIDFARTDAIIVIAFSWMVGVASGRKKTGGFRGSYFLVFGLALQSVFTFITSTEGSQCGGVLSDLTLSVMFGVLYFGAFPLFAAGVVAAGPLLAYGVLARIPRLFVRSLVVAVIMIAFAGTIVSLNYASSTAPGHHCVDL